jgi:predicted RNA binding protein YcfA (HicA-like mRNA interferase family)
VTTWTLTRSSKVFAALLRIGWSVKRQSRSHRTLQHASWPDFVFAFHTHQELGERMLERLSTHTGLQARDL